MDITDDMVVELDANETFRVALGGISRELGVGPDATLPVLGATTEVLTTISDPRSSGLVSIAGPLGAADGGGEAVFTVRVDGTTTEIVTVTYSVGAAGDTATGRAAMATEPGADYISPATGTVEVPAGTDSTATINIPTVDSLASESAEFFSVSLASAVGGGTGFTPTLGATGAASRSATAAIAGEPVTIVLVGTTAQQAPEGESATFTLTLSGPPPLSDIFLPYNLSGLSGTYVTPADFGYATLEQERRITLAEMAAARRSVDPQPIQLIVPTAKDRVAEVQPEFVRIGFPSERPARGGGLGDITTRYGGSTSGFLRIFDDPTPLVAEITAMDVSEGGGAQNGFIIRITRDGVVQTASSRDDLFRVRIALSGSGVRDTDYTITGGAGAFIGETPTAITLSFNPTFATATTSGDPLEAVVVVTPTDDSAYGGDKTVTITLREFEAAACSHGCGVSYRIRGRGMGETDTHLFNPATLRIIDDEPQLSIAGPEPASIAEGAAAVFTVTLRNPPATGNVTVDWAIGTDADAATADAEAADFSGNTSGTLTFSQGAAGMQSITLQTALDAAAEAEETFSVVLSNAMGGAVGLDADATSATAVITANAAVSRTLALSGPAEITEGGSATYMVTLTGDPPAASDDLAVSWSVGADSDGDTADAAAGDFGDGTASTLPGGTLTFTSANAATPQSLTLAAAQNTLSTADKVFTVTISVTAGDGGGTNTLTPAVVTTTIGDDDPMTASLTLADASLDEETDTQAMFGISLSGAAGVTPGEMVTATWEIDSTSTASGGAAADMARDYTTPATTSTSTLATSTAISILLNNDNLNEGAETLVVRLLSVSGANVSLSGTPADLLQTATIAANDATTVAVSGPGAAVAEGGSAVFTLAIAGGVPSADVSLPYTLSGISVSDLSGGAQLRSIASIPLSAITSGDPVTITIGIADDDVVEAAETLTLTLDDTAGPPVRRPGGAGGGGIAIDSAPGSDTATATISASDAAVLVVSAEAASVDEDASNAAVVFNLALEESGAARRVPADATVTYTLSGTAAGGVALDAARDYAWPAGYTPPAGVTPGSGTLQINAGSSTARLMLALNDDVRNEANEEISLTVSAISGGGSGSLMLGSSMALRMATAAIADDDDLTVSIAAPSGGMVTEGADAVFAVSLSGGTSTAPVMVAWSVGADSDGMTADTAAADTTPNSGTLEIGAGAASGMIRVMTVQDGTAEMAEVFVVSLGTVSSTTRTDAVAVSSTQGSAAVTIPQNVALQRTVNLSGPAALAEGTTSSNYSVSVSGSAPTADLTVSWSIGTDSDSATSDAAAADFSGATSGTLTFTAANHATPQTFTLTSVANTMSQADKVVVVSITASGGGMGETNLGTSSVTTTLTDDDALSAALTLAVANLDEETDTQAAFGISLSGAPGVTLGEEVTATWQIAPASTATGGAAADTARDYTTPASFTTTIAMGASSAALNIALNNDNLNEGAETLVVRLLSVSGANVALSTTLAELSQTATIAANDATTVRVSGPADAVQEGSDAVFTLTLGGGVASADIVLRYTLSGVPADDLAVALLSGERRVPPAEATSGDPIEIRVGVAQDARVEAEQTLTLTLDEVSGGGGGGTVAEAVSATATLAASDAATVLLSAAAARVDENGENAAVVFNLELREGADTRTLTVASTVSYTLSGTAAGGAAADAARDYTWPAEQSSAAGSIEISPNQSAASIRLPINNDGLNEATETLVITLTSASSGVLLGASSELRSASAEIADDDDTALRVTAAPGTDADAATEGVQVLEGAMVTFQVIPSAPSAGEIRVAWSAEVQNQANTGGASGGPNTADNTDLESSESGVSATAAGMLSGGTLSIAPGEVLASFSFLVRSDLLEESAERVRVLLDMPSGGAESGMVALSATQSAVEFIIPANQAAAKSLAVSSQPEVDEGAQVLFRVTLQSNVEGAHTQEVEVDWALDGTATALPGATQLARAFPSGGGARDYSGAVSGTLSFPVGVSSRQVSVPVQDDALNEGAETLRMVLGAVREGGQPALVENTVVAQSAAITTITASDPIMLSLVRVADDPAVVAVGDIPATGIRYRLSFGETLVNGVSTPIVTTTALTIPYTITLGGTPRSATLTAAPGQSAADLPPIVVTAEEIQAALATGTADVAVSLQAPSAAAPPDPVAGVPAPTASATPTAMLLPDAQQSETRRVSLQQTIGMWRVSLNLRSAEAPEGAAFQIAAVLRGSEPLTADLSVPWRVVLQSGDGRADAADFDGATSGDFTFPAGTSSGDGGATQQAEIRIANDDVSENAETFQIELAAPTGADSAQVAVDTNPAQVQISPLSATLHLADATAAEGQRAVFRFSLAAISGATATARRMNISYAVGAAGDTATRGDDYRAAETNTLVLDAGAAGDTIGEIGIEFIADGRVEGAETFTITLTEAVFDGDGGGSIIFPEGAATFRATGTILDSADESSRRQRRTATLVAVLDRAAADMAAQVIGERIAGAAQPEAALSLAGRKLTGAGAGGSASGESGAGGAKQAARELGLALYGAAGTAGTGGGHTGAPAAAGAFRGLGAGLAGADNMGRRTPLPSRAELLQGSHFQLSSVELFSKLTDRLRQHHIRLWGRGSFTTLHGTPQHGGAHLNYRGDSLAVFAGADSYVKDDLLAGVALGYATGDVSFNDSGEQFALQGKLSSNMLSLHPYLGWQIAPRLHAWLMLGIGSGGVDMEERQGDALRTIPGSADSVMHMAAGGLTGQYATGAGTDLKLRFSFMRVQSQVDAARFDDNTPMAKMRARSARVGGGAEIGRRFDLPGGMEIRPFGSAQARFDRTHKDSTIALDFGAGAALRHPALGIEGRIAANSQINGANHEQRQFSLELHYDSGGDNQGLRVELKSALESQAAADTASAGNAAAAALATNFGANFATTGAAQQSPFGGRLQQSLRGELAYGLHSRAFGAKALLTPYARFAVRQQNHDYAAGLRLQAGSALKIGLEAGLDDAGGAAQDQKLLLTGALHF